MSIPEAPDFGPPDAPGAPPDAPDGPPAPSGPPSAQKEEDAHSKHKAAIDAFKKDLQGKTEKDITNIKITLGKQSVEQKNSLIKLKEQFVALGRQIEANASEIESLTKANARMERDIKQWTGTATKSGEKKTAKIAEFREKIESNKKKLIELNEKKINLPNQKQESEKQIKAMERDIQLIAAKMGACNAAVTALKPKLATVQKKEQEEKKEQGEKKELDEEYAKITHYVYDQNGAYDSFILYSLKEYCFNNYDSLPKSTKASGDPNEVTAAELEGFLKREIQQKKLTKAKLMGIIDFDPIAAREARIAKNKAQNAVEFSKEKHYQYDEHGKKSDAPLKALKAYFQETLGYPDKIVNNTEALMVALKDDIEQGRVTPEMISVAIDFDIEASMKNKQALDKVALENKKVKGADKLENYQFDMEGNETTAPQEALKAYLDGRKDLQDKDWFTRAEVENDLAQVLERSLSNGIISIEDINKAIQFDIGASIKAKQKREEEKRAAAEAEAEQLRQAKATEEAAQQEKDKEMMASLTPEQAAVFEKIMKQNQALMEENAALKQQPHAGNKPAKSAVVSDLPSAVEPDVVQPEKPGVTSSPASHSGSSVSKSHDVGIEPVSKSKSFSMTSSMEGPRGYFEGDKFKPVKDVSDIMLTLERKNDEYLKLYANGKKERTGMILFKRITADTKAKKQQALDRQVILQDLKKKWQESVKMTDPHKREAEQEKITILFVELISRDLQQDSKSHGLVEGTKQVGKMLTEAQNSLQDAGVWTAPMAQIVEPKPHLKK